jgi:6,7-dimethyl-8-ribityllumazine synthase
MSTETYSPPAGGIDGSALSAADLHLAIVVSRFNHFVTYKLRDGAIEAIEKAGGSLGANDVIEIPGAWEFPVIVRALAHRGYDAIVCVGAVIRGDTPHFDYVAGEAARGIADASAESGVPIAFGVLTTNTVEQATDRAGGRLGNKGFDAAMTAIEMALTLRKIRPPRIKPRRRRSQN